MNVMDCSKADRQGLLTRLLDAVKQCQIRFGGKTELATETYSCVSCLCSAWESVLQHGLRHQNKALSTFKQMTEMAGLTRIGSGISLVEDLKNMETEPSFWQGMKSYFSKHEMLRYLRLQNVTSEAGRGRAWLRAALNEHSLERYMHTLLEDHSKLSQYYEDWAFLRDHEKSSTLPNMAAGLGSILFAIVIDNPDLNTIKPATGLDVILSSGTLSNPHVPPNQRPFEEPRPVIAGEGSPPAARKREKKKKKKMAHVVSFDEDEFSSYSGSPASSMTSPRSLTAGFDLTNVPPIVVANPLLPRSASFGSTPAFGIQTVQCDVSQDTTARAIIQAENANIKQDIGVELNQGAQFASPGGTAAEPTKPDADIVSCKSHEKEPCVGSGELSQSRGQSSLCEQLPAVLTTALSEQRSSNILQSSGLKVAPPADTLTQPNSVQVEQKCSAPSHSAGHENHNAVLTSREQIANYKDLCGTPMLRSENPLPQTTVAQASPETSSATAEQSPVLAGKQDVKSVSTPQHLKAHGRSLSQTSTVSLHSDNSSFSLCEDEMQGMTLTPVGPDGKTDVSMVVCKQDTSSQDVGDLSVYSEATESAAKALLLVQQGFLSSETLRTQGDGSNTPDPVSPVQDFMTTDELKQAVIAMMLRKEEVEEHNRALRALLETERETGSALRLEMEEMKKTHQAKQERDSDKIKSMARENDLLKHQLKKYVNAVQMLRRQGARSEDFPGLHLEDIQPAVPPAQSSVDYSQEASEYERKLVQVAEMHGELLEFNELLQKQLMARDLLLQRLRAELTDLRGPLPEDGQPSGDNCSLQSEISCGTSGALVNVWIPSAFLRGAGSDVHHVYQVYVRIREEEWNVYRRYSEFYQTHASLKKNHPLVTTFKFPPKKAIGHKDTKFVEERRQKLQLYLRRAVTLVLQQSPDLASNTCRLKLCEVIPFFGEPPADDKKGKGKNKKMRGGGGRRQGNPTPSSPSEHQYMGL